MLAGFPVYFVKASSIARACIRYWLLVVVFRIFLKKNSNGTSNRYLAPHPKLQN
jgi:hypothetical protein